MDKPTFFQYYAGKNEKTKVKEKGNLSG